ncbi:MAG: aspartyl protease family protein [Planctomycetes bacterium]|nr:aspartyl protease family protein [Planctomycetota bacterium]
MKLLIAAVVCLAAAPHTRQSPFDVVAALTRGKVESERYHATLSFETFTSLIQIPAKLGARECRMVVDTGAPMVITPALAKELHAELLGTYETNDSTGHKQDREFVLLPTVEIGGARFSDLAAIVVDLHAIAEFRERSIDGLIGGNLLRHGALAIDYGAKTIEFASDAATLAPKDGLEVPFDFSVQAMPIFELSLGGAGVAQVTLDTGSNSFLELPASLVDRAGPKSCLDIQGSASTGAFGNAPEGERLCRLDGLALAGTVLPSMVVAAVPGDGATVGIRFFEKTRLVIDWPRKKLHIADAAQLGRLALRTHGLAVKYVDSGVQVATVLVGSSAARAKLAPGERVLAVDDLDLSSGSLPAFARATDVLRDEARATATVVVEIDGKPVRLELVREQLLPD